MTNEERKERVITAFPPKAIKAKVTSYVNKHKESGLTVSSVVHDALKEYLRKVGELPQKFKG